MERHNQTELVLENHRQLKSQKTGFYWSSNFFMATEKHSLFKTEETKFCLQHDPSDPIHLSVLIQSRSSLCFVVQREASLYHHGNQCLCV